jgi:hypothetical protein
MAILQLQQQNVVATAAYTEYSFVVPVGVFDLTLAVRGGAANLFWYTVTTNGSSPGSASNLPQSPNTYNTIPAGASRTIPGKRGGQTIYIQVDQSNQTIEIDYHGDI